MELMTHPVPGHREREKGAWTDGSLLRDSGRLPRLGYRSTLSGNKSAAAHQGLRLLPGLPPPTSRYILPARPGASSPNSTLTHVTFAAPMLLSNVRWQLARNPYRTPA